jgi:hypothetical protein
MKYSYLVLISVIAGIGEAIRKAGVNSKYIPFINLMMGLILGMVLCYTNPKACILDGLYIGLSASGLVSSTNTAYSVYQDRHKSIIRQMKQTKKGNIDCCNEHDDSCCEKELDDE